MPGLRRQSWLFLSALFLSVFAWLSASASAQTYVRGYTKSDGTYVAPHYRSSPDGNFSNNWSTKGNINPYTGKLGTRVTPPADIDNSYYGGSSSIAYAGSTYLGQSRQHAPATGWTNSPFYSDEPSILLTTSEPDDARLRDVAAMNYHGIGFSTTHKGFLQLLPHAKPASPTDSAGIVSYAIEDLDGKRDAIWFQFLNDQFLRLGFVYGESRIREYGGTRVLENRAKVRFGAPTRKQENSNIWEFATIDRIIMTGMDGNSWYLVVTRMSSQKSVNEERARVDVGF